MLYEAQPQMNVESARTYLGIINVNDDKNNVMILLRKRFQMCFEFNGMWTPFGYKNEYH